MKVRVTHTDVCPVEKIRLARNVGMPMKENVRRAYKLLMRNVNFAPTRFLALTNFRVLGANRLDVKSIRRVLTVVARIASRTGNL